MKRIIEGAITRSVTQIIASSSCEHLRYSSQRFSETLFKRDAVDYSSSSVAHHVCGHKHVITHIVVNMHLLLEYKTVPFRLLWSCFSFRKKFVSSYRVYSALSFSQSTMKVTDSSHTERTFMSSSQQTSKSMIPWMSAVKDTHEHRFRSLHAISPGKEHRALTLQSQLETAAAAARTARYRER